METEKFELMLDEAQANAALEKGMLYADTFVNKNYLINLDRYPLVELDPAEKSDEYIRLYQIASCLKNDSAHIRKGAFDKIDFEDANNEMQSLVESWLGMELYQTVSTQFSNFAFFGLSALGSNPDMDNKIPKFRPFRVADPFLWILSQENIIPTE